jgi:hypothetical protein
MADGSFAGDDEAHPARTTASTADPIRVRGGMGAKRIARK